MQVLVVEDDAAIRLLTRRALDREGYSIVEAADGAEALRAARRGGTDVALVDLGLPDMSGLDLIAGLRSLLPDLHVIIVSGAATEVERVQGLVAGADDYMVKPISLRELAARLVAVERRAARTEAAAAVHPELEPGLIRFGDITIDLPARVVTRGGVAVELTRREFDLLSYMALHPGVSVSRERLLEVVWSSSASWQSASTVTEHVRRLRAKLEDDPGEPRLIVTVRGAGYRLEAGPAAQARRAPAEPAPVAATDPGADDGRSDVTQRLRQLATGVGVDVSDAVIIATPDFRIESVNPAAESLYGASEADLIGKSIFDAVPWVSDGVDGSQIADQVRRDGRWRGAGQQLRLDGTSVAVRVVMTELRSPEGEPVGVVSVNRPIIEAAAPAASAAGLDPALVADLRRGLAAGEFEVFYQPILQLGSRSIFAVEALMRWRHPQRGVLEPAAFFDAAERSGLILDIGAHVLETAGRQFRAWRQAGHELHLSVNLSARQLTDLALPEQLESLMIDNEIPVGSLWLEVTETTLIDDIDRATAVLERTEMLGACMLIDDFGTGWAGLTYLHQFPVQALKIDRVFVAGLGKNPSDRAIVRSVLSLGRELGLVVIAEGIETEVQLAQLRRMGCRIGQGYLFSRPVPAAELDLSLHR
jgi:PAS domain S-box-containing protein